MNLIIADNNGVITMLSIDMVYYINATRKGDAPKLAHADFLKKVPKVLGEEAAGKFTASYRDSSGKKNPCYSLPKREACLMAMSYSYELQADIFDRWQELEAKQAPQVPQTMAQALRLAADQAELIEQQNQQLAIAAPKVAFVDSYVERTSLQNATQVGQTVGMSATKLNRALDEIGGVYNKSCKRGRAFVQAWIESDYGEMKQTEIGYPQALFTTKGVARVAELLTTEGVI